MPDQPKFTHLTEDGSATMVDVGDKRITRRKAVAECYVMLSAATFDLLVKKALPKGDVLTTAKIAGVMAAKKTADIIPFCHSLGLDYVDIFFDLNAAESSIRIQSEACVTARTGVEMEALVAAQAAALTVYDMCKAVQKDIRIEGCRLLHKSGGRSGDYNAAGA